MSESLILAIDQGTTNTKALLIDSNGCPVARASRPMPIEYPQPGWVEQDALQIWRTVEEAINQCLEDHPAPAAVAIANQRESVIVWDRRTGAPLGPCIVWQCRRTAPFCAELRRSGLEPAIRAKTGLGIDPLFSASKMRWLLDRVPDGAKRAAVGELCAGTVDSWLLFKLTAGRVHACDATNASRTQLLNLESACWDQELLEMFGIPRPLLPDVKPSSGVFGVTAGSGRLEAGVPVASLIGDSHAAMFAHAAFRPDVVKATYGTGSSLMTLTRGPVTSTNGLSGTIAWAMPGAVQHALEGNITVTGGAVDWVGQFLGLASPAEGAAALAATVADSGGVYLAPAFAGLGAPYWNDTARGLVCGLTRGATAAHLARAAVESIAYQVGDVFEAIERDTGAHPAALMADGGASRNDALMQFQADILRRPVIRNLSADLSAVGAAWLAGLAIGVWRDVDQLESLPRAEQPFKPVMPESERERLLNGWRDAISRALLHASI